MKLAFWHYNKRVLLFAFLAFFCGYCLSYFVHLNSTTTSQDMTQTDNEVYSLNKGTYLLPDNSVVIIEKESPTDRWIHLEINCADKYWAQGPVDALNRQRHGAWITSNGQIYFIKGSQVSELEGIRFFSKQDAFK